MHIPIIRPVLGDEELENVGKCLASGYLTQGKFVARFEQSVADYLTCRHAVAVTSGTAALHLALLALSIGPGDEVVVPSLTWVATANAVSYVGATPVFADVRPETFTLDPEDLARALTPRTRAVIAVHLFGLCADMDEIRRMAAERDLFVVEDAACALGSSYQGDDTIQIGIQRLVVLDSQRIRGSLNHLIRVGIVERKVTPVLSLFQSAGNGKIVETPILLTFSES